MKKFETVRDLFASTPLPELQQATGITLPSTGGVVLSEQGDEPIDGGNRVIMLEGNRVVTTGYLEKSEAWELQVEFGNRHGYGEAELRYEVPGINSGHLQCGGTFYGQIDVSGLEPGWTIEMHYEVDDGEARVNGVVDGEKVLRTRQLKRLHASSRGQK